MIYLERITSPGLTFTDGCLQDLAVNIKKNAIRQKKAEID